MQLHEITGEFHRRTVCPQIVKADSRLLTTDSWLSANLSVHFQEESVRFLDRLQPLALLGLRLLLAVVMIGHGYGKVFHGGLGQHVARVSSMGLPGWLAYPSAFAEFFGGILVLAGLFTRCAALAIAIDMVVAIWKVHWKNGLLAKGGMEFPLALIVIAFALMCFGAGPIAIDAIRGGGRAKKKPRPA